MAKFTKHNNPNRRRKPRVKHSASLVEQWKTEQAIDALRVIRKGMRTMKVYVLKDRDTNEFNMTIYGDIPQSELEDIIYRKMYEITDENDDMSQCEAIKSLLPKGVKSSYKRVNEELATVIYF